MVAERTSPAASIEARIASTDSGASDSIIRRRPCLALRTAVTGLASASPHSTAIVNIAWRRFIALRTASAPTPSASSCVRHWATMRGLIRRSSSSPNRGSTRFSHARTCCSTVSGSTRAPASATQTGLKAASVVVSVGLVVGRRGRVGRGLHRESRALEVRVLA